MKKIVLLITILFVSVISTACINNIAVQELNNKAQEYMEQGETDKAISRLRSSIDLDTSIFESHYNLGVALIKVKEYEEAQASLLNAISLKPEFADSYYSLAIAMESQADSIVENDSEDGDEEILSESDKVKAVDLYNSAIENYNKYLVKKSQVSDKEQIEDKISLLNDRIREYSVSRDSSVPALPKKGVEQE